MLYCMITKGKRQTKKIEVISFHSYWVTCIPTALSVSCKIMPGHYFFSDMGNNAGQLLVDFSQC